MFEKKNESGRSIVEVLGVLAIMGVITIMGISGYSQAVSRINRNKTVEDVTRLAQETRSLYSGRQYDTSLNLNVHAVLGIDVNKYLTPYNGYYTLAAAGGTNGAAITTGTSAYFYVTIRNLPYAECVYLGNATWGDAVTNTGGSIIDVNSGTAYSGDDTVNGTSTKGSGCVTGKTSNSVTIYYR